MDMSIADKNEIPNELNTSITLELGDIIEVISPANDALHENSLYIKYIDNKHIRLINVATLKEVQLNIDSPVSSWPMRFSNVLFPDAPPLCCITSST